MGIHLDSVMTPSGSLGAQIACGKLSEVLVSWSKDEIALEERLQLMDLLFENTFYKPTLEDLINCSHHIRLRLKLLLENREPKRLEHLSKTSFRNHLIAVSNGQSLIQTIKNSKLNWPKHFLNKVYDI